MKKNSDCGTVAGAVLGSNILDPLIRFHCHRFLKLY